MKKRDAVPHFIEQGEDQTLALPIYFTRDLDEKTRRAWEALKQQLVAEAEYAASTVENGRVTSKIAL